MAHSINTSGEISDNRFGADDTSGATPVVQGPYTWFNPVLTVRSREGENDPNRVSEVRFLFKEDGIVVNPWAPVESSQRDRNEGPYCQIVGEDLFALRELLAEIPEEAFVRPVDPPVESFCFVDGTGDFWVYSDHNQSWHCGDDRPLDAALKRDRPSAYEGFDSWQSGVASYGMLPVRQPAPAWVDGDAIIYHVRSAHEDWVRVRQGGQWESVTGPSSTPKGDDWADQCKLAAEAVDSHWTVKPVAR